METQTLSPKECAEERLFLRALIDLLPDLVSVKDSAGKNVWINHAKLKELGLQDVKEAIGKSGFDFFDRATAEGFQRDDEQVIRTGQPVINRREKVVEPNGEIRWHLTTKVPWRDTGGNIAGVMSISRDITGQTEAAIKLEEERNLIRTLIDHLPDAIYAKDANARKIMANPADLKNLGCTAEADAIGKTDFDFFPREIATAFFADDQTVLKDGKTVINREEKAVLQNGETRWLLTSKIPWRDAEGNIIGLVGIGRDITEKKNLEAEVLRAQRTESLGRLATGIAHDLNNTLAPVLISVELLRHKLQDKDSLYVLAAIESSARRAADTIKQVLSFSREAECHRTAVNLCHLADGVVRITAQMLPKNIRIETQVAENLCPIPGNPLQLHQMLLNLCVNAGEAMPDGGRLTLAAHNFTVDAQFAGMHGRVGAGPHVLLEVSDTGGGIAPELRDRIFEPFFTTKELGTKNVGLGLSTALSIAKSHCGVILVKSEIGKGSTFQVYLPVQPDTAAEKNAG
ncbi:MAG TPA: PAS domain-containing protein [Verrucomicrobiae bacterium]|jgi:PAS domain S-box-containing protein